MLASAVSSQSQSPKLDVEFPLSNLHWDSMKGDTCCGEADGGELCLALAVFLLHLGSLLASSPAHSDFLIILFDLHPIKVGLMGECNG